MIGFWRAALERDIERPARHLSYGPEQRRGGPGAASRVAVWIT
jgi:hypothetical protein